MGAIAAIMQVLLRRSVVLTYTVTEEDYEQSSKPPWTPLKDLHGPLEQYSDAIAIAIKRTEGHADDPYYCSVGALTESDPEYLIELERSRYTLVCKCPSVRVRKFIDTCWEGRKPPLPFTFRIKFQRENF